MLDAITKVPPQNVEAERSLLGSMMIEKDAILDAVNIVDKDCFYEDAHAKIFQVIVEMYDKSKAVDIITVTEELKRKKLLEDVGGTVYLTELIDSVATAANTEYYANIIHEKSILRKLIRAANKIIVDSFSGQEEADNIMDSAEQSILDACKGRLRTGFVAVSEIMHDNFEALETIVRKKEQVHGIPSGFTKLDELTAGFHPSNLIIIAARPSMGKTSFCLNIAEHVAIKEGKKVAIFSLEMSKEELLLRMLCSQAKVNSHKLRTGYLKNRDWPALTNAAGLLSDSKIYLDDSPSLNVLEMKSRARRLQAEEGGLDLVIIDYLQLMAGRTGRSEYRQQDVSEISRSLKIMAKDLKVPVIAVSQLSREPEKRENKKPVLSDLRESGSIEQDADLVIFIYRDEIYKDETEKKGIADIIIGKHRNGKIGIVELTFLADYTRFENATFITE